MKFSGYGAALLSGVWALVHTFIGGPEVAAPLLASGLPDVVRVTAWMTWHMVTGVLFFMAVGFAVATWSGSKGALLAFTALAAVLAVAGVVVAVLTSGLAVLPQGLLFVPVAALGLWAARPLALRASLA